MDVQQIVEDLASLGIETRVRPSDAAPLAAIRGDRSLVRLLRFQARNLLREQASGSGTRGKDLDALSAAAGGGSVSPLVAAWAESGSTPAATWAASIIGQTQPPDFSVTVFPSLALIAFVADVTGGSGQALRRPTVPALAVLAGSHPTGLAGSRASDEAAPARVAVASGADFCAQVSAYLSAALGGIIDTDAEPPAWLRQLIDVYAPQYASDPDLLRRTIGALALLSYATSLARPWSVNLAPDPSSVVYGIEGQDPVQGDVTLTVSSGKDVFGDETADCAALADAQLAAAPISGSTVIWDSTGLGAHAIEVSSVTTLDDIASAGLTYETTTESKEVADNGDPVSAQMSVSAWVDRAEMAALAALAKSILLGEVAGTPAGPTTRTLYQAMEPALNVVMRPSGFALIDVTYHRPKASPTPSQRESQLAGTWVGTWAIDPPYAGVVGEFTMELAQTGGSFSGAVDITNTDCSNGPVNGTIDGTSLTFGWLLTPQPVQFSGVLNGESMSGTWASVACSDPDISLTGTWEATKQ